MSDRTNTELFCFLFKFIWNANCIIIRQRITSSIDQVLDQLQAVVELYGP